MTTNQDGPNTAGAAELKACPFCGAAASLWGGAGLWAVSCNMDGTNGDDEVVCGMEGPPRITQAEAIAAWNARPVDAGAAEPVADGERIGLAVWCVSIADHHADVLTPRQIEKLYAASDALRALSQRPSVVRDEAHGKVIMASVKLGRWMSAALDDPGVCDEMKSDIREWFSAGEPVPGWTAHIQPVVPDEVVEAAVKQGLSIATIGTPSEVQVQIAYNVARAAIPLIRAQAVAEIVAWLRMGEHVHSRSGSIESERVFKLIADAIERGEHEND